MPINANYEFENAQEKFHRAENDEDRLEALEEMMRTMPKHKSAEALRKNIRTRYKKLKQSLEKKSKKKGSGKPGIRKEDMQAALIGLTNSGKSSILKAITNANPKIASYGFTTYEPEPATLKYNGCKIQIIDSPPIGSEGFNMGIINTADTLLLVVEKIHEIKSLLDEIPKKAKAKQIIVFNKIDLYDKTTQRKISETLKSKKYNFIIVSTKTDEGLEELKEKIFKSFNKIRVFTKTSGKKHDNEPVVMPPNSTVKDIAEKILHGFSKNIVRTKIKGPSSKFSGQQVGLEHKLKDLDTVEFFTR